VWNGVPPVERKRLITRDLPFLLWELDSLPQLRLAVCAGRTVTDQVKAQVPVKVTETGSLERVRWWIGTAHLRRRALPIGGWNYPLDRPTGLGKAGEIELGRLFRGILV
jgi:hypothetical protein